MGGTTGDHEAIRELAYLYGRGVDARTAGEQAVFDHCLTEDVVVDYGEFGAWEGLETHKRMMAEKAMTVFTFTHHIITNDLIEVSGDTATASYRVTAAHGLAGADGGEQVIWAGANYFQDCIRTPQGWRIARHLCTGTFPTALKAQIEGGGDA